MGEYHPNSNLCKNKLQKVYLNNYNITRPIIEKSGLFNTVPATVPDSEF